MLVPSLRAGDVVVTGNLSAHRAGGPEVSLDYQNI